MILIATSLHGVTYQWAELLSISLSIAVQNTVLAEILENLHILVTFLLNAVKGQEPVFALRGGFGSSDFPFRCPQLKYLEGDLLF